MKNFGKILGVVSAGLIASVLPICYASAYDTVYTTDYLRVREAPSLDAAIIDVVSPGTAIQQIQELDNGWSEVLYNGSVYYMFSYYLTSNYEDEDEINFATVNLDKQSNIWHFQFQCRRN